MTSVVAEGLGLLVSWNPDPVGEQVTSYTVTAAAAAGGGTPPPGCAGPFTVSVDGSNSAGLVGGLCTAVAYQATVSATNGAGTSLVSPAFSPVVPLAAQPPQAPLITSVFARDGALIVSWTPPGYDGGDPLSTYTLTATAGSATTTVQAGPSATQATISGLADGTAYGLSLTASSAAGTSAAGTDSGTPEPAHPPAGPGQVTASPDGTGAIDVSWVPPADDGGDALTGFTITWQQVVPAASGGGYVPAPGSSPQTTTTGPAATSVTLPAGDFNPAAALYSVTVAASNTDGTGPATAAANPVAPVTAVSPQTVVLSAATMSALGSDTPAPAGTGSVLVWPAPPPAQVSGLSAGQVLVASPAAAAPQGLMDTVTGVSTDAAGDVTVTTTPAALTSVFTTLAVATSTNPLAPSAPGAAARRAAARFVPKAAGIRDLSRRAPATAGFSDTLSLGFDYSTGNPDTTGASVAGELDLTPDLNLTLGLDHGFAGVPDGVSLSASATATLTDTLTAEAHTSFTKTIGEIDGAPIDIQIGPVPLVIVPKVPLTLSVNGKIGMQLEASVSIGASLSWDSNSADTLSTADTSTAPTVTAGPLPGLTTTGQLSADVSLQPQLDLYDAGGPNLQGDAILAGTVNLTPPPGGAYLSVIPSLQLSAGLDVDLLGEHKSLEVALATKTFPPFQILNPPSATITITPANPEVLPGKTVQLTATRSDHAGGHPVTWTLVGAAGDTITSSGLFTAANPPGRTVTVYATDNTGATGLTTITIGTPFDPVSNLQAAEDSTDTGAQVTWDAPAHTGGSAIKDYVVTTSNGVPAQTTTSTSATLPSLHPGITYTITVYPANTKGQTGPAASTTLYVIPLCTDAFTGGPQGTGTAWNTPGNWSAGQVPTAADWVCASSTIDLPAAAVTVQGIQAGGTLTIPAGGTLTVTNTLTLNGTLAGPGTATLPAGSAGTLNCPQLSGVTLVNQGALTVASNGCGYTYMSAKAVLQNAGTITLQNGAGIDSDGSAVQLVNQAGATISYPSGSTEADLAVPVTDSGTIQAGAPLAVDQAGGSGSPSLTGKGPIHLTGTGSLPSGTTFAGLGALDVDGTLPVPATLTLNAAKTVINGTLAGPGTATLPAGSAGTLNCPQLSGVTLVNQGALTVASNGCGYTYMSAKAVLQNAGTITLQNGAGIDSDGSAVQLVNQAGATISYPSGSTEADLAVPVTDSGTIQAGAPLAVDQAGGSGSPSLTGKGPIHLTGTGSLPSGTTFAGLGALDVDGTLPVPATLTLNAAKTVINGTLAGPGTATLPAGSAGTLNCPQLSGVTLVNQGALTVASNGCGYTYMSAKAVLQNAGTITLQNGAGIDSDGSAVQLVNQAGATISYPSGSTEADLAVPVTDSGTIQAGAPLAVDQAGGSGSPSLTGKGPIHLTGTGSLPSGTTFAGLGALDVDGTLPVPATLTLNAAKTVINGTLAGPGTATLPAGSAGTLNCPQLSGVTLVNQGALTVASNGCGYTYMSAKAVLQNAGTITLQNGAGIDSDGSAVQLVNQAGATISYPSGSTEADLAVPVTDSGTIQAGAPLGLGSSYSPTGTATLAIAISGSKKHGQLAVSGTATLGGTLALKTASNYTPPIGTTITILTTSKRSGTFSKITGITLTGEHWSIAYSATRVTLTAVSG